MVNYAVNSLATRDRTIVVCRDVCILSLLKVAKSSNRNIIQARVVNSSSRLYRVVASVLIVMVVSTPGVQYTQPRVGCWAVGTKHKGEERTSSELDEGLLAHQVAAVVAPAARGRRRRVAQLRGAVLGRERLGDGRPRGAQRGRREAAVARAGLVGPGRLLVEVVLLLLLGELGIDGGEAAGDCFLAEDLKPASCC